MVNVAQLAETIHKEGYLAQSDTYGHLSKGYSVTLVEFSESLSLQEFDSNELRNYITMFEDVLANSRNFLLVWIEDGIVCLDIALHFPTKYQAEREARERGQKKYFDLTYLNSIKL